MTSTDSAVLLRRGRQLEAATLAWNAIGIVVLAAAAIAARSVALAGFDLDSLIEIGASTVVLWELSGTGEERRRKALRLIAAAFLTLAGAGWHGGPGHRRSLMRSWRDSASVTCRELAGAGSVVAVSRPAAAAAGPAGQTADRPSSRGCGAL